MGKPKYAEEAVKAYKRTRGAGADLVKLSNRRNLLLLCFLQCAPDASTCTSHKASRVQLE
jgi:hypothetical protein